MPETPPEPALEPADLEEFKKGIAEFNAGRFFECHDTLEEIWRGMRGPSRNFFQGLIQVAVGFYHLSCGNPSGGESQLGKGLKNLAGYGDCYLGLDIAGLRCGVQTWLDKIARGDPLSGATAELPRYRLNR